MLVMISWKRWQRSLAINGDKMSIHYEEFIEQAIEELKEAREYSRKYGRDASARKFAKILTREIKRLQKLYGEAEKENIRSIGY